jgi:uncharacterized protein
VKVVFDTNVLLAAFLTEGLCAKLLTRARKRQFELVLCPCVLTEFKRIMTKKLKANHEETVSAIALLTEAAQSVVTPDTEVHGVCRDKSDDQVLACARAAAAVYLVTGDADLLVLEAFEGVRIVSPRDFEGMLEG